MPSVRKTVDGILRSVMGREVKFTVRRIGFTDLARTDAYFVKLLEPIDLCCRERIGTRLRNVSWPDGTRVILQSEW